jgi:hypothetical protein
MRQLGLTVSLSPVIPRERVPGKQHLRTRFGYRTDELATLDQQLTEHNLTLQRALCRIDNNASPWETVRNMPALATFNHIEAVDWLVEFASTDEVEQANRTAEAIFACASQAGSNLFLGPLMDLDRTMDITYGLLDRQCNPRPVFNVVRCLNTLLFSALADWQPVSAPTIEQATIWGLASADCTLWLLLPNGDEPVEIARQTLPQLANSKEIQAFNLREATSQHLHLGQTELLLKGAMVLRATG